MKLENLIKWDRHLAHKNVLHSLRKFKIVPSCMVYRWQCHNSLNTTLIETDISSPHNQHSKKAIPQGLSSC